MPENRPVRPDPIPIGDAAAPPFVRLPDASNLFRSRAERFRWLAQTHGLKPYLLFLAGLSDVQHQLQAELPRPGLPDADALLHAREFSMPPLHPERLASADALGPTLDRLVALAGALNMPDAATSALASVAEAGDMRRDAMIQSVLVISMPAEMLAEHIFVAAALQVHFAGLAGSLDAGSLVPVADGACPACGYPPTASMVVGWLGAHGARYCGCALCGTLRNYVRIKCALCGSIKGISYWEIEGGKGMVKAETCGSCHSYVKILQQDMDPAADVVADDVANLGLDLLMRGTGFRRGGFNPFLAGY